MRSLFLVMLLIGVMLSGVSYALNAPSIQGGNPDNWYSEVKYEDNSVPSAATAEHGSVLIWDTTAHDGYTVIKALAADSELAAGVVPSGTDYAHNLDTLGRPIKDGDVFLMQIKGYHKDLPTDGNVAAGQALGSETSGYMGDGDGFGVGLETDAADTSSPTQTSADVYINVNAGAL